MKVLSIIEATTVNAVAKGAIEFLRTAREVSEASDAAAEIEGTFVTYDRRLDYRESPNEFVLATRTAGIDIDIIHERRRFDLSVIPKLRTVIEARNPDLVITHAVKSHFLMWRSGLAKRYPWLAFHHGYTTTDRMMGVYNRMDRWSLTKADRVLTVCHAFARELAAITNIPVEQILVQHNAIRPKAAPRNEVIQALRTRVGIQTDERVILSVGRLSKEKAHADLITAFALLRERSPSRRYKLVIVGAGPECAKLQSTVNSSSFSAQVVFAGSVEDVQPFYSLADVFVLPSRSEGSPNVLLEAMAAGVPVVATKVGGVPEIVSDGETALLVPVNDPKALAKAIETLLIDTQVAHTLRTSAEELVATKYRPEPYAHALVLIYETVVKARTLLR